MSEHDQDRETPPNVFVLVTDSGEKFQIPLHECSQSALRHIADEAQEELARKMGNCLHCLGTTHEPGDEQYPCDACDGEGTLEAYYRVMRGEEDEEEDDGYDDPEPGMWNIYRERDDRTQEWIAAFPTKSSAEEALGHPYIGAIAVDQEALAAGRYTIDPPPGYEE